MGRVDKAMVNANMNLLEINGFDFRLRQAGVLLGHV